MRWKRIAHIKTDWGRPSLKWVSDSRPPVFCTIFLFISSLIPSLQLFVFCRELLHRSAGHCVQHDNPEMNLLVTWDFTQQFYLLREISSSSSSSVSAMIWVILNAKLCVHIQSGSSGSVLMSSRLSGIRRSFTFMLLSSIQTSPELRDTCSHITKVLTAFLTKS